MELGATHRQFTRPASVRVANIVQTPGETAQPVG